MIFNCVKFNQDQIKFIVDEIITKEIDIDDMFGCGFLTIKSELFSSNQLKITKDHFNDKFLDAIARSNVKGRILFHTMDSSSFEYDFWGYEFINGKYTKLKGALNWGEE